MFGKGRKEKMKLLVCGSRDWNNEEKIREILKTYKSKEDIVELINGGAHGADSIAAKVGKELGFKVTTVEANWKREGRAAGPIRNQKMVQMKPDRVIAFHDDIENSKGTKNMIEIAKRNKVPYIILIDSDPNACAAKKIIIS